MKRKFLVAIVCLAVAALLTWRLFDIADSTKDVAVVVKVARRVDKGTLIAQDMLRVAEIGAYGLEGDLIESADSVTGKYAATDLFPEDNLTAGKFTDINDMADNYVQKARDASLSAVSVGLGGISAGLSGKLKIGDVVSALVFVAQGGQAASNGEVISYPELKFLEIADITNNRAEDIGRETGFDGADTGKRNQGDAQIPASVTFLVNQEQALRLVEAENTGKIHLVFQGRGAHGQRLLNRGTESKAAQSSGFEERAVIDYE
jgi:pilus assembly protein CpaB